MAARDGYYQRLYGGKDQWKAMPWHARYAHSSAYIDDPLGYEAQRMQLDETARLQAGKQEYWNAYDAGKYPRPNPDFFDTTNLSEELSGGRRGRGGGGETPDPSMPFIPSATSLIPQTDAAARRAESIPQAWISAPVGQRGIDAGFAPVREQVLAQLRDDEGFRPTIYKDTRGNPTVGYGTLVSNLPGPEQDALRAGGSMTRERAEELLGSVFDSNQQAMRSRLDAEGIQWEALPSGIRAALSNMSYQMGGAGVAGFDKAITALKRGDMAAFEQELLDSEWARTQSPNRAQDVVSEVRRHPRQGTGRSADGTTVTSILKGLADRRQEGIAEYQKRQGAPAEDDGGIVDTFAELWDNTKKGAARRLGLDVGEQSGAHKSMTALRKATEKRRAAAVADAPESIKADVAAATETVTRTLNDAKGKLSPLKFAKLERILYDAYGMIAQAFAPGDMSPAAREYAFSMGIKVFEAVNNVGAAASAAVASERKKLQFGQGTVMAEQGDPTKQSLYIPSKDGSAVLEVTPGYTEEVNGEMVQYPAQVKPVLYNIGGAQQGIGQ